MNKLLVRQAVAYGLDRAAVVRSFYGGRGQLADQFLPPIFVGHAKHVKRYPYDPARSRALLRKAGLKLPVKVDFWFPTDVSRPYMPDPKRNFESSPRASAEPASRSFRTALPGARTTSKH